MIIAHGIRTRIFKVIQIDAFREIREYKDIIGYNWLDWETTHFSWVQLRLPDLKKRPKLRICCY